MEVLHYSIHEGANTSTILDIGAIIGSTLLGFISDKLYGKRGPVTFTSVCISCILIYALAFGIEHYSLVTFLTLMFFFGMFLSGLNNLVQGSCAADIGKSEALKNNKKSTSTVIGIIDATGAFGSGVG